MDAEEEGAEEGEKEKEGIGEEEKAGEEEKRIKGILEVSGKEVEEGTEEILESSSSAISISKKYFASDFMFSFGVSGSIWDVILL